MSRKLTAVSLFTSGGIGDLAIRASGFDILVSNELLPDRHGVFTQNFPDVTAITGDVWEQSSRICRAIRTRLKSRELDLLYATPPCQGMSKNGRGKLLNLIRAGMKPPRDQRNRLIIPAMKIACRLRPRIVLLENVSEMRDTVILDERNRLVPIVDYVAQQLGSQYVGSAEVVEFADYGVPQRRQRLITIFSRDPNLRRWFEKHGTFLPPATHAESPTNGHRHWVTVRQTIADLPPLDAKNVASAKSSTPHHSVPVLDEMKYWWVSNTPPEQSAFDNQCVACRFQGNASHLARRNEQGINRSSHNTPLHCEQCGAMLPRPSTLVNGRRRIMRGFTSAYKRMSFDKPASALTRNLSYACSDNKLHPEQNRVLSMLEAFRLHTLDQFGYRWEQPDGRRVSDKTIREIIGESIPPAGFKVILDHLVRISRRKARAGK